MRLINYIYITLLLLCMACEDLESGSSSNSTTGPVAETQSVPKPQTEVKPEEYAAPSTLTTPVKAATVFPEKQPCKINGSTLDGNEVYIRNLGMVFSVVADHTTYHEDLGESHRVFQVYTVQECNMITRNVLPINVSPDYPYLLGANTYDPVNQLVCVQGFESVYCYNIKSNRMLLPMTPKYTITRREQDAQSGLPGGMHMEGKYLITYAIDKGFTGYDLNNVEAPKSNPPAAEFSIENGFISLFILKTENGLYQLYFPSYDQNKDPVIQMNPLFESAQDISPRIAKGVRNNRFIVLRHKGNNNHFVVDMKNKKRVEIPEEIAVKNVQEVRKWVKENKG